MKFLELCAGIGGFRQALENLGCECVGYSEIDKKECLIGITYEM